MVGINVQLILNYSSPTTPLNKILEQKVQFLLYIDIAKTTVLERRMRGDLIENKKIHKNSKS